MKLVVTAVLLSASAQAQHYSYSACTAYTECYKTDMQGNAIPDGHISCEVFGAARINYEGGNTRQCNWLVEPYTAVSCQGYVKTFDPFGNIVWGWKKYQFRCPGR